METCNLLTMCTLSTFYTYEGVITNKQTFPFESQTPVVYLRSANITLLLTKQLTILSLNQDRTIFYCMSLYALLRNLCFNSRFKLELWEPLLRRFGTQNSIPCRRQSLDCSQGKYQPRIPRAPFLCGCCYSSLRYGGRDGDLQLYCSRTQHLQWLEGLNIPRR